jgi:endonuclease/exonuclease/phosphatase (EEP) superfamily protein YafD
VAACLIVPQVWAIAAPPRTPVEIPAANDTKLRVMSINVLWSNSRYDAVVKLVERENPDIVALQEVSRDWHTVIERLAPRYPHVAPADWRSMRSDNILLSRHPIRHSAVVVPPNQDRYRPFAHVDATIDVGGAPIRVLGVHPPLPAGAIYTGIRQVHLDYYANLAKTTETPLLIVGDFNITPYSPRFRAMLDAGGLRYVHLGWTWPRSWPSENYGRVQKYVRGFPIDHILTSRHFAVAAARALENVGSDHYPVAAELFLRR